MRPGRLPEDSLGERKARAELQRESTPAEREQLLANRRALQERRAKQQAERWGLDREVRRWGLER